MKPVLLEVSQSCGSAWVPVAGSSRVVVEGLTGESHIKVEFGGAGALTLRKDGEYTLPGEVSILRAEAVVLEDDTKINMDLV